MDVYFCSTYYHVLITCLKSLMTKQKIDLIVLEYINEPNSLVERIRKSGLFEKVNVLKTPEFVIKKNLIEKLYANKLYKSRMNDFQFSFNRYNNIYLFMDDTWIARYCKLEHIKYHLIEDSLDAFKYILKNRYRELVSSEYNHLHTLYKIFPYAEGNHKHFLSSEEVLDIEVNQIEGTIFEMGDHSRLLEVSRNRLFKLLEDEKNLNRLLDIFIDDRNIIEGNNIVLVFTSPFYADKIVKSEDEQLRIYRSLIEKYSGHNVFIKAHPRDAINYSKLGNIKIVPKNFPSELIAYLDQKKL